MAELESEEVTEDSLEVVRLREEMSMEPKVELMV